jgi:hypothetical protein
VSSLELLGSAADLTPIYLSQRKFAEAEPLARKALEFNRKQQPDDWQRFRAESLLGESLAGQKRYVEAEPLLLLGEWRLGRSGWQSRIVISLTGPAHGLSNFIGRGASRTKRPTGGRIDPEPRARSPIPGGGCGDVPLIADCRLTFTHCGFPLPVAD